jgi:hypothetical protein
MGLTHHDSVLAFYGVPPDVRSRAAPAPIPPRLRLMR